MRKLFSVIFCLFSIFLTFHFVYSISVSNQEEVIHQEEFVPNEVLVKFKKDASKYFIQDAINSVQGKVITYLGEEISTFIWDPSEISLRSFLSDPKLFHIKVPEIIGAEESISVLSTNPNVEYAEKNGRVYIKTFPNDTHFIKLWGLHNTGQSGGTADADIDGPEAWTNPGGGYSAVISSGLECFAGIMNDWEKNK